MVKIYPAPGRCVYCGARESLGDEHVIPRSLFGDVIFREASCATCAKETSKFEGKVAGAMFGTYREAHSFPRYKAKKKKPRRLGAMLHLESGDVQHLDMAKHEFPAAYLAPHFPPPGILTGAPLSDKNPEVTVNLVMDLDKAQAVLERPDVQSASFGVQEFPWGAFCRMLAKIGHAFAAAEISAPMDHFLPPLILGNSPFLSHYVGGLYTGAPSLPDDGTLAMTIEYLPDNTPVPIIFVKLPGFRLLPWYTVVVGRLLSAQEIAGEC